MGPIGNSLLSGWCFFYKPDHVFYKVFFLTVDLERKRGITRMPFGRTELSLRLSWIEFCALLRREGPEGPRVQGMPEKCVFMIVRGGTFQKTKALKTSEICVRPDHRKIIFAWFPEGPTFKTKINKNESWTSNFPGIPWTPGTSGPRLWKRAQHSIQDSLNESSVRPNATSVMPILCCRKTQKFLNFFVVGV